MAWPSEPEGATTAPVADMPVPDAAITSSCSGSSSTSGAGARGAAGSGPASVPAPACTPRDALREGRLGRYHQWALVLAPRRHM